MKIVLLSQWYPPEPARLLQELAQTLQEQGHSVTVLTGFPNYPTGQVYPGYKIRFHQREVLSDVHLIRVPLYANHSSSGIKRILNYISFAVSSSILGPWLVSRPDVMFVYHPPLTIGLPAYVLSRVWRVPFVYQVQDMWPETLKATGMLNSDRVLQWIGGFAKFIYRKASAICVISEGFRQNLLQKGVPDEKVHVISNWVDANAFAPVQPESTLAEQYHLAGKFNIMFAGNMGEAQALETIIEAASLLKDLPQIQFVMVGDGVAHSKLTKLVSEKQLNNVLFLGRHPEDEMPKLFALADVLLVHLKADPLFRITVPHKIFAYMASAKPIIAAVDGDAADMVTRNGAGMACPPENPVAIADVARRMYQLGSEERYAMAENGLKAVHSLYSRPHLVAKIEEVLRAVAFNAEVPTPVAQ